LETGTSVLSESQDQRPLGVGCEASLKFEFVAVLVFERQ